MYETITLVSFLFASASCQFFRQTPYSNFRIQELQSFIQPGSNQIEYPLNYQSSKSTDQFYHSPEFLNFPLNNFSSAYSGINIPTAESLFTPATYPNLDVVSPGQLNSYYKELEEIEKEALSPTSQIPTITYVNVNFGSTNYAYSA